MEVVYRQEVLMGMEEDLLEALRHASFGTGKGKLPLDGMLGTLMNTVEINTIRRMQAELAKMQGQLNERILKLSKQKPKAGVEADLDPYTILGIRPDATKEEVKKAYSKKAWKAHPDHGGDVEQMTLVNAAREAIFRFKGWS